MTKISFDLMKASNLRPSFFIAALDEVGRGPLAGPVVATCLYWSGTLKDLRTDLNFLSNIGINDSKQLKEKERDKLLDLLEIKLKKNQILSFGNHKLKNFKIVICENSHNRIDKINILQASLEAMDKCWKKVASKKSGKVLIDGNKLPKSLINDSRAETIIKGDSKSLLIGLASICAKVYRDRLMIRLAKKYPGYGLERHAGYPTKAHKEAIQSLGISPIHRTTFKGVKEFII